MQSCWSGRNILPLTINQPSYTDFSLVVAVLVIATMCAVPYCYFTWMKDKIIAKKKEAELQLNPTIVVRDDEAPGDNFSLM